jgi:hypothetical protein
MRCCWRVWDQETRPNRTKSLLFEAKGIGDAPTKESRMAPWCDVLNGVVLRPVNKGDAELFPRVTAADRYSFPLPSVPHVELSSAINLSNQRQHHGVNIPLCLRSAALGSMSCFRCLPPHRTAHSGLGRYVFAPVASMLSKRQHLRIPAGVFPTNDTCRQGWHRRERHADSALHPSVPQLHFSGYRTSSSALREHFSVHECFCWFWSARQVGGHQAQAVAWPEVAHRVEIPLHSSSKQRDQGGRLKLWQSSHTTLATTNDRHARPKDCRRWPSVPSDLDLRGPWPSSDAPGKA